MLVMSYKLLMWGLEAKAFSGPLVNFLDDLSHVFIAQIIDVFPLWDVLPDQTVGVFVKAPLPGVIGMCKEPLGSQLRVRSLHGKQILCRCRRSR